MWQAIHNFRFVDVRKYRNTMKAKCCCKFTVNSPRRKSVYMRKRLDNRDIFSLYNCVLRNMLEKKVSEIFRIKKCYKYYKESTTFISFILILLIVIFNWYLHTCIWSLSHIYIYRFSSFFNYPAKYKVADFYFRFSNYLAF